MQPNAPNVHHIIALHELRRDRVGKQFFFFLFICILYRIHWDPFDHSISAAVLETREGNARSQLMNTEQY